MEERDWIIGNIPGSVEDNVKDLKTLDALVVGWLDQRRFEDGLVNSLLGRQSCEDFLIFNRFFPMLGKPNMCFQKKI